MPVVDPYKSSGNPASLIARRPGPRLSGRTFSKLATIRIPPISIPLSPKSGEKRTRIDAVKERQQYKDDLIYISFPYSATPRVQGIQSTTTEGLTFQHMLDNPSWRLEPQDFARDAINAVTMVPYHVSPDSCRLDEEKGEWRKELGVPCIACDEVYMGSHWFTSLKRHMRVKHRMVFEKKAPSFSKLLKSKSSSDTHVAQKKKGASQKSCSPPLSMLCDDQDPHSMDVSESNSREGSILSKELAHQILFTPHPPVLHDHGARRLEINRSNSAKERVLSTFPYPPPLDRDMVPMSDEELLNFHFVEPMEIDFSAHPDVPRDPFGTAPTYDTLMHLPGLSYLAGNQSAINNPPHSPYTFHSHGGLCKVNPEIRTRKDYKFEFQCQFNSPVQPPVEYSREWENYCNFGGEPSAKRARMG